MYCHPFWLKLQLTTTLPLKYFSLKVLCYPPICPKEFCYYLNFFSKIKSGMEFIFLNTQEIFSLFYLRNFFLQCLQPTIFYLWCLLLLLTFCMLQYCPLLYWWCCKKLGQYQKNQVYFQALEILCILFIYVKLLYFIGKL